MIDLKRLRIKLEVCGEYPRAVPQKPEKFISTRIRPTYELQHGAARSNRELKHAGIHSQAENLGSEWKRYRRRDVASLCILLSAVATFAYIYYYSFSAPTAIETLAVLPFANASADPDTEYLSDGICESLINSLAKLDQVRVVARGTAFRYKGRDIDPRQAGRELKVRAILTGRVKRVGDELDVQVDLIDVATGRQLWGEEYQGKVSDIMAVKQEIAGKVTDNLRLRLTADEQQQLARTGTVDPESYKLYLNGRFFLNRRNAESLKKAIDLFNRAIERDPDHALAYVGLADSFILSSAFNYGDSATTVVYPQAQAAIERALAIDDSLGEAHTTSAFIQSHYRWDWPAAEAAFRRALQLNPRNATGHHWYARHLIAMGNFEKAKAEIRMAQSLDPLSPIIASTMGDPFYYQRNYDEAVEQNKKALELDPNFGRAHFYLMLSYQATNRFENAIAERQHLGASSAEAAALRKSFARHGKRGYWRKLIEIVRSNAADGAISGDRDEMLLRCYAQTGDNERAFEILDRMIQERFEGVIYLNVDPVYDPLRADPRFPDFLRRIGLPI